MTALQGGSMSEKTLYGVLEVANGASLEVIQAAYARLKAVLEPKAVAGDEAALIRLRALRDAHRTLADPALRARYDRSLAQRGTARAVPVTPVYESDSSGFRTWMLGAAVAVALAGGGAWYHSHQQRVKAERALQEKAAALAKMEEERQRAESEAGQKDAARLQRIEDERIRQWQEQTRREAALNQRQNQLTRQRVEQEERREQQRAERAKELQQAQEDAAAKRRLEEEKRKLRQLQYENSRR